MNLRILGVAAMVLSCFWLVDYLVSGGWVWGEQFDHTSLSAILNLLFLLGWIFSLIGLIQIDAAGKTGLRKIIPKVQLLFVCIYSISMIQDFFDPGGKGVLYNILNIFWPISNLFMLVTGLAVLTSNQLKGWRASVPLIVGLWRPLSLSSSLFLPNNNFLMFAAIYSFIAWMLLGYLVASTSTK